MQTLTFARLVSNITSWPTLKSCLTPYPIRQIILHTLILTTYPTTYNVNGGLIHVILISVLRECGRKARGEGDVSDPWCTFFGPKSGEYFIIRLFHTHVSFSNAMSYCGKFLYSLTHSLFFKLGRQRRYKDILINMFRFPAGPKHLRVLRIDQNVSGDHTASFQWATGALSLGVKQPEREASPLSIHCRA